MLFFEFIKLIHPKIVFSLQKVCQNHHNDSTDCNNLYLNLLYSSITENL